MLFSDAALRWLEVVLEERFGYRFHLDERSDALTLSLAGSQAGIRFDRPQRIFHQSCSDFPCRYWRPSSEGFAGPIDDWIPAPSEPDLVSPLIERCSSGAVIHYDILGLVYWMLTRLEELHRIDFDEHGRFPATSSHAFKQGYLERPVVDEWLMVLGQVINRVWPLLELKQHEFSIKVSHDVDRPSLYAFQAWPTIGRMMAGHLLKRRDLKAFLTAPFVKLTTGSRLIGADPFNTFDWLMDVSEAHDLKSAFYFICGRTDRLRDADYEPEHPAMRDLMRRVHERGHEIGLHPSYGTFLEPDLIRDEFARLKRVCEEEGIQQKVWGGRMHYLRWRLPTTLRAWADAGIDYDSTLGYADRPGFRCGTCHEYPAFDPVLQSSLTIRVRPLVVMESSIVGEVALEKRELDLAYANISRLMCRCKHVFGGFTLLWHNSSFTENSSSLIYNRVLSKG